MSDAMAGLTTLLATLERLELRAGPAPPEDLRGAQIRIGTALPSEVVAFYEHSDGTQRPTPVERGWVRLWMLSEWLTVYIVDGLRPPRLVAHSLIAFVEDVLADRDSIYPTDAAAVHP